MLHKPYDIESSILEEKQRIIGENDALDARSDQYALGLILYELLGLERALQGKTSYLVLLKAANADKPPLQHAFGRPIPRELRAIVARATAPRPDDRYPSVEAMADDVRRFLRDEAVLAAPDSLRQRVGRWVARHRQTTIALMGLLVSALLFVSLLAVVGGIVASEMAERAAQARHRCARH